MTEEGGGHEAHIEIEISFDFASPYEGLASSRQNHMDTPMVGVFVGMLTKVQVRQKQMDMEGEGSTVVTIMPMAQF